MTFRFSSTLDAWSIEMDFTIIRWVYGFRICNIYIYLEAYEVLRCSIDNCHHPTNLSPSSTLFTRGPIKSRKLSVCSEFHFVTSVSVTEIYRLEKKRYTLEEMISCNLLLSVYMDHYFTFSENKKDFHHFKEICKWHHPKFFNK